jgi:hypothetical protein
VSVPSSSKAASSVRECKIINHVSQAKIPALLQRYIFSNRKLSWKGDIFIMCLALLIHEREIGTSSEGKY